MREIKFRAWDKSNNEMCFPDAFFIFTGDEVLILNPHNVDDTYYQIESCDERFIQMQFTGLIDKNGKEIYEGDIIGYITNCGFSTSQEKGGTLEEVKYKYGGFQPFAIAGWEGSTESEEIEVIGNIYQDSELLK